MNLKVTLDNLADRRSLLKGFDDLNRGIDRSGAMQGLDSFDAPGVRSRSQQGPRRFRRQPRRPARPRPLRQGAGRKAAAGAAAVRIGRRLRHRPLRRLGHARQHRTEHEEPRPAGRSRRQRFPRRHDRPRPRPGHPAWSSPASSAGRRASTAAPAATTGRRCPRWPSPAAVLRWDRSSANRPPRPKRRRPRRSRRRT